MGNLRLLNPEERAEALQALGASSPPPQPGHSGQESRVEKVYVSQPSYYNRKLRLFSGKIPVPSGETNFKTWRRQVYQLEKDEEDDDDDNALPDHQLKRLILQSLQPPALDTVWNMDVNSEQILEVLDNLYGSVVDGQDLLLQLQTTYQADKETSSEYIQRLYLLATEVAERHGICLGDIPYQLLRQFIRGGILSG